MKKVLLIARAKKDTSKQSAEEFASKVQARLQNDVHVENCEISELFFEVGETDIRIYHPEKQFDIRDFDLVIIRHIGAFAVEAHAITLYCEHFGVQYTDTYLNRLLLDNKMSTEFLLWTQGVTCMPRTFYGPVDELARRLPELGNKVIVKDNEGSKGRLNFVVESEAQLRTIVSEHPTVHFVLQEFIPNDSDLRVLVLNGHPSLVIRRSGDGSTHLNNTSQGGRAELVPLDAVSREILEVSVAAAEITKLQVAGVDVVVDKETGKFFILEVNNAPQVSSGSFKDEKVVVYADMILSLLGQSHKGIDYF